MFFKRNKILILFILLLLKLFEWSNSWAVLLMAVASYLIKLVLRRQPVVDTQIKIKYGCLFNFTISFSILGEICKINNIKN